MGRVVDLTNMDANEVLALYDAEMRRDAPVDAGYHLEHRGTVVRMDGPRQRFILYSRPSPDDAAVLVEEQLRDLRTHGGELEWKIYSHDLPANLPELLRGAGFRPDPAETLMVLDLKDHVPIGPHPEGLEVRRVRDEAGLSDAIAVGNAAFGRDDGSVRAHAEGRLNDPRVGLFVAYLHGVPVSTGRVELPERRSFASIWGGGTRAEYRRLGIYRALVSVRASLARDSGFRFLTVDARDATSRPILERVGFTPLAGIVGWILTAPFPADSPASISAVDASAPGGSAA